MGFGPGVKRPLIGVAVAMCFASTPSHANPSGPAVMSGSASFSTSGSTLTVTNSPGAIIHWQQFSIQPNEVTRFLQQSASSAVLNRVMSGNASAILGTLSSNGRVFLINPSGITIGAGARIDVAGFAASTLNLSDADFLSGRRLFQGTGEEGALKNAGRITTPAGGFVYLVAPNVENQAEAVITSPKGEVIIAAGRTVELVGGNEPDLRVEFTAGSEAVNAGEVVAAAGRVGIFGTLVRNSGHVSASRAEAGPGGKIVFRAGEDALLESGARVEAVGDTGGTVHVLGRRVGVLDGAKIDASGDAGGGTVLVGGDLKGGNPDVPNAWRTYFGGDAEIRASGGKVIVWSDDVTRAYGTIKAPGGLVEVSGANLLDFAAKVEAGTILLDPLDIRVQNTGGTALGGSSVMFADAPSDLALSDETLEGLVGNIVLQASRDITVENTLGNGGLVLANPGQGITLQAGRNISVGSAIVTDGGAIHIEADSPHAPVTGSGDGRNPGDGVGKITFTANGALSSGGGHITLIAGGQPINNRSGPDGGIVLSANHLIDAGGGGINIALAPWTSNVPTSPNYEDTTAYDFAPGTTFPTGAPLGVGSLGLFTQIFGNPMEVLRTTGALVIGTASTAGTDGQGAGSLSLLAHGISNIYPGSAINLTPQSGSSFQLIAGDGGILLDQPLITYQDTVIRTTGVVTINDPINTTNSDLQITAASVVTGSSGSINTGSGSCSGPGCPVSNIYWSGLGDGISWSDPENWSSGSLPSFSDAVTIASGEGTIIVDFSDAQAKSLIANRALEISSSGALELAESSQFSDLLTIAGGSLHGAGSASVTGPGGGLLWTGGSMGAGGDFQLVSGRSGTLLGSLTLDRLFQNEGLLTLSSAALSGTGAMTNSGTVTAAAGTVSTLSTPFQNISNTIPGTLQVNGVLTMNSFPVNEGAILVATNGAFSVGTMNNLGTATVDGSATFGTLSLGGGAVGGTGDLTVTTDYNGGAGTLGSTFSDLSLAKSGAFTVDTLTAVDSITLRAGGAVTLNGDLTVSGGSADSIVISGASFQNSGGHALVPGAGRYLVWSGDPAADNRGGLGYDFKQYNADFGVSPVLGAGNGFLYSVAPTVTAGLTGSVSKVYDTSTAAALSSANFTVTGAIDGDTVALNNPAAGNYFDKNVGSGKTVAVGSLAIASASDGAATVYGYQLGNTTASAAIGTITPASLAGSVIVADKVYDATPNATIAIRGLSGVLGGDVVTYSGGTASFSDKNVGAGKLVTATGLGLSGADAGNYTVNSMATTTASISAATLTGFITASDKVYDATTGATIAGRSLSGVLGSDSVTYSGGMATFGDKNVGTGKLVTATGLGLTGADAGNYSVNSTATTTASITPSSLTGSITAADKVYDATNDATITGRSLAGVLGSDNVTYAGGTATFEDKNAGVGKLVTATGLALAGTDAGNYTVNTTATTNASITPAPLLLAAASDTKIYDATSISSATPSATGLVGGDSISGLAQSFDSPEVGNRTLGVLAGYAIDDGSGGANYTVSLQTAPGTITPADLPPSALPVVQVPVPESNLTTVDLGTTLYDLNSGQNVALDGNSVPDPGIYLSQDTSSVVVVGQSQLGSQLNVASTLLFPAKNYDPGLYVQAETGALYAVEEGTVLDPGVYYDKDTQTVLVVSSNDDGNVTVKSADIKEAVETVSSGRGSRRVAAVSCR